MVNMLKIKGVLLDLEGVLYVGDKLVDGAIECVNRLKSHNLRIRYLTNTTTTSRKLIAEKLKAFKLPVVESDIFSPVIAANNFLKQKNISKVYLLANQSLQTDFENVVFVEENSQAIILGDIYRNFNWDSLNKAFQLITESNVTIIALHKNRYCRRGERITLDLGPFVEALEYASNKKAIIMGKPEKNFFDLVLKDINLTESQVTMIGDDIISDIAGAKNNNITAIQVKTGKYQKMDESDSFIQPDLRINSIADLPYHLRLGI